MLTHLKMATWTTWLHGIHGIQDTRQIVDGKTIDKENNDKQSGAELCQAQQSLG